MKTWLYAFLLPALALPLRPGLCQRIQPEDLVYEGAFRLPDGAGGADWTFSGNALAYYPLGDPDGPDDGYPGSLFGTGSDPAQFVSEIGIPVPVISPSHNVADLPVAPTLQPFRDVFGPLFDYLELPVAGLAYLPAQGAQAEGRLYFCRGQHIQYQEATHGWFSTDLSAPEAAGPWRVGTHNNYTTSDYLFEIPAEWADAHVGGRYLASGRFREGVWGGFGPALYAMAPWADGNPPPPGAALTAVTPLLLYGLDDPGIPEIVTDETMRMEGFNMDDFWTGAAWLTAGDRAAVVFAGAKGLGDAWYGFGNGVVWPYEGPYPPFPDPPYDARGFWADSISARMLFYDPADLAAVAAGTMQPYEPQPYAELNLDPYLFDGPGYHYARYKDWSLGAVAYDRARGLLYVLEFRVEADEEKSLVHVWRVTPGSTGRAPEGPDAGFVLDPAYPNPASEAATIGYTLPRPGPVRLVVYDLLGRRVRVLVDGYRPAGTHRQTLSVRSLVPGCYLYRLETPAGTLRHTLIVGR